MSPEEFSSLFDPLPDMCFLVTGDGTLVAANRTALRTLAGKIRLAEGTRFFDLVDSDQETARAFFHLCSGSKDPVPGVLTLRNEDGPPVACRCTGRAVELNWGGTAPLILLRCEMKATPKSAFSVLNRQIAELTNALQNRQRAETTLAELNEKLEQRVAERTHELAESNDRLRRVHLLSEIIIENAMEGIVAIDCDMRYTVWNPGMEALNGKRREDVLGRTVFEAFPHMKGDPIGRAWQDALAGRPTSFRDQAYYSRRFRSGLIYDADFATLRDHGKTVGAICIVRDITERHRVEEALRQAQKMEAIGQLTGGVAHDFNNLLTVIIGHLEILERTLPNDSGRSRAAVSGALRGSMRAVTLTQRLLAFSRRQPLNPRPVDVNKLIAGMSDLFRRTLGEIIKIETVLAGGLWRTEADPGQLENALLNLAVNARDAMPEGGKLTIESANAHLDEKYVIANAEVKPGQYVVIAVTDTGIGMSKDVLARVFEPFFTTKQVGQGTGLGLSQVYGFVKQSNGHVKIYSEVGGGTTVKIYLPRLLSGETDTDVAEEVPIPGGTRTETVLIVEDDEDVRGYSVGALRELGYHVLEAGDGLSALRLLERHPAVDLLFTDVGLPNMNGRQLADEAQRRHPALKVLFTTGYAKNAIVHQGRLDRGVHLIVKPFTYGDLAAKIREVLDTPARGMAG